MRELGGYTLTHRLGVGGMGEVWKGSREALGGTAVDVAIKVLTPGRVDDPEARQMFLDEARLTMLLTNSNIVKVFDAAEAGDGTCYMVMEWVDGLNLAELNAKLSDAGETLPDEIIAYIIGEVLKGLAHAHDLRHGGERYTIVHRDISPHNVMISVSGEVKVMDFGIARMASEDTSGSHVKGKLRYMPPEQLRGMSREPTLDLFAVGAVLHELLDQVKFRGGVDEGRLYGMILDGEIPHLMRSANSVPKELDEIRKQLLAANPADRIQTAREAFVRLSRWSGYRDARFELDEIVRRVVGESEPKTAVLPVVSAPVAAPGVPIVLPPAAQVGSFTGHAVDDVPAGIQTPATLAVAPAVPKQPEAQPDRNRNLYRIVLAFCGIGLAGLIALFVVALSVSFSNKPKPELKTDPRAGDPAVVANVEPEPTSGDPAPEAEDDDLAGPRLDFGSARQPPTTVEDPPEPGTSDTGAEQDEVEVPVVEPATKPAPAKTKTTKVTLTLGGGVPWAEVKAGSRSFVLDAFGSKSASTRLPTGTHTLTFRTKVDGAWQSAGRVDIPAGRATLTLQKSGEIVVK
ncbi:serine/threonine protein kinase [Enhygromyxa salina]|uniref:Serine/threonine protein kinase n=1 Tax=Enhygromyxa salina TaxID=215803 RepID=A0A0C2D3Q5_9BACT|nr:serine/threonine protein kinase [Enhygromyxa salina]